MSTWTEFQLTETVVDILSRLPPRGGDHHFGRPWMTAYQLVLEIERQAPDAFVALGGNPGGASSGGGATVAQVVARELSRKINADPAFPIEGADLSTKGIESLRFGRSDGLLVESSVTGGSPLSMFRYRG